MNHTPSGSCARRLTDRCTRPDCRERSNRYLKAMRVKRQAGIEARIPVGPIADRLNELRQTYSLGYLAHATGVGDAELSRVSRRKHPTVHVDVARRILAFKPRPGSIGQVDATGTRRRLQALAFAGWSFAAVSRRVGGTDDALSKIARGLTDKVAATKAEKVEVLFRELWDQPGGDTRIANLARRKGWLPAMAWDCIDDPDEQPAVTPLAPSDDVDDVAVERAIHGRPVDLTPAERVEAIRRMTVAGASLNQIATTLGMSLRRVRDLKERHHLTSTYTDQRSAS